MNNWQASKAGETLSGMYKFKLVQHVHTCVCVCMCMYGGMCANSSACHAYIILWVPFVPKKNSVNNKPASDL